MRIRLTELFVVQGPLQLLLWSMAKTNCIMLGISGVRWLDLGLMFVILMRLSDSRNVFDRLQTEELSTHGAERRTSLELMCRSFSKDQQGHFALGTFRSPTRKFVCEGAGALLAARESVENCQRQ